MTRSRSLGPLAVGLVGREKGRKRSAMSATMPVELWAFGIRSALSEYILCSGWFFASGGGGGGAAYKIPARCSGRPQLSNASAAANRRPSNDDPREHSERDEVGAPSFLAARCAAQPAGGLRVLTFNR